MQSLQRQAYDANNSSYQTVREFLQHCNLSQYYEKFIFEGFDSVASVRKKKSNKVCIDMFYTASRNH